MIGMDNSLYQFYEECAIANKVNDSPEQIKAWMVEADEELEKFSLCFIPDEDSSPIDTPEKRRKWLYWQLRKTVVHLRAHESGQGIMSDFATIHNIHIGLSEILSFDVGQELLKAE